MLWPFSVAPYLVCFGHGKPTQEDRLSTGVVHIILLIFSKNHDSCTDKNNKEIGQDIQILVNETSFNIIC